MYLRGGENVWGGGFPTTRDRVFPSKGQSLGRREGNSGRGSSANQPVEVKKKEKFNGGRRQSVDLKMFREKARPGSCERGGGGKEGTNEKKEARLVGGKKKSAEARGSITWKKENGKTGGDQK